MVNNRTDINHVLQQMRTMRSQMQQNMPQAPQAPQASTAQQASAAVNDLRPSQQVESAKSSQAPGFGQMFKAAIDTVNASSQTANDLRTRFEMGDPSVDLPTVMVAAEKSSISFQAMTQVRNKLVESYKEIMNMPI